VLAEIIISKNIVAFAHAFLELIDAHVVSLISKESIYLSETKYDEYDKECNKKAMSTKHIFVFLDSSPSNSH
jgi:hypothetical protein